MIWMRSSELSRLAAVTAAVAASTTEVIWLLVSVLESVLLLLRVETLACLEVLAVLRLALNSAITVEARVVEVVVDSEPVDEESLLEQEETSNAMLTIKTNQENKLFIIILLRKCLRKKTK
jgi:hypothetical protein